jgi:hypothetical protein
MSFTFSLPMCTSCQLAPSSRLIAIDRSPHWNTGKYRYPSVPTAPGRAGCSVLQPGSGGGSGLAPVKAKLLPPSSER